jgi:hypothetical protein
VEPVRPPSAEVARRVPKLVGKDKSSSAALRSRPPRAEDCGQGSSLVHRRWRARINPRPPPRAEDGGQGSSLVRRRWWARINPRPPPRAEDGGQG